MQPLAERAVAVGAMEEEEAHRRKITERARL